MKKLILIVFLTCTLIQFGIAKHHNPVSIISTHGIVYLKFEKSMIGATLEVRDENGLLITEEIVAKKKIIVDFFYRKTGCYEIKVRKDKVEQLISIANDDVIAPEHVEHIAHHKHRDKVLVVQ